MPAAGSQSRTRSSFSDRRRTIRHGRLPAITALTAVTLIAWGVAPGAGFSETGPAEAHGRQRDAVRDALHRAGRHVEEAWEAFHRAALGGTLMSPAVQTKIERALHESRRLLTDAREAAKVHDRRTVFDLTARVSATARHIKEDSRRRKP